MRHLEQFLILIINKCLSSPKITISLFIIFSFLSIFLAAEKLKIITSTEKLISEDVEFKKKQESLRYHFPIISDNIIISIKSKSIETLDKKTSEVLKSLEEISDELDFFYSPNLDYFFKTNFFYLIDENKQNSILQNLYSSQPFLSEINNNSKLVGLNNLLRLSLKDFDNSDGINKFEKIIDAFNNSIIEKKEVNWKELLDNNAPENLIILKIKKDKIEKYGIKKYYNYLRGLNEIGDKNTELNFTGGLILDYEEVNSVIKGASFAGILSLIIVFFILCGAFRKFSLMFILIFTILIGLILTIGLATLIVGNLNIISVAFAVLFIGISVDYGIQFCFRYQEVLYSNNLERISHTVTEISSSLFIVTITSLIGFLSFVPTKYVGLSELGMISSIGLIVGLITNLVFLPSCLLFLKLEKYKYKEKLYFFKLVEFLYKFKYKTLFFIVILLLLGLISVRELKFDSDPLKLKDQSSQSLKLAKNLMEKNPASDNFISIYSKEFSKEDIQFLKQSNLIKSVFSLEDLRVENVLLDEITYLKFLYSKEDSDFYSDLNELDKFKENLKIISDKKSLTIAHKAENLLKEIRKNNLDNNKNFIEAQDLWFKNFDVLIEEINLILNIPEINLSNIPDFYKKRYLSDDGLKRIEIYPAKDIAEKKNLKEFVKFIESRFPNSIGMPIIQLEAGEIVIESFIFAFSFSFLFLLIFSFFIFRKLTYSILCISPLIFSTLLIVLIMNLLNLELNFANMISLPLLFSLGTSYSIYIFKRCSDLKSVDNMLKSQTPYAVIFSGFTTIGSFGTFAFSNHAGTASMGLLLFISLLVALFFCVIVLPFIMKLLKLTF